MSLNMPALTSMEEQVDLSEIIDRPDFQLYLNDRQTDTDIHILLPKPCPTSLVSHLDGQRQV